MDLLICFLEWWCGHFAKILHSQQSHLLMQRTNVFHFDLLSHNASRASDQILYRLTLSVLLHFRPYHAMLLLVEETSLLESLPPDSSPALTRLIRVASPLKSLQDLATDADVCLGQVRQDETLTRLQAEVKMCKKCTLQIELPIFMTGGLWFQTKDMYIIALLFAFIRSSS